MSDPTQTLTPEELRAAAATADLDDAELLQRVAEPEAPPQPRYEAALPADWEARHRALGERQAELAQQFRNGELEFDDFEAKRDELLRERETLTVARTKAEIAAEMQAQTVERQWSDTVQRFLAGAELDYRADPKLMADLDQFVRDLAGRREHANKPMPWFLQEAHRRVLAQHADRDQVEMAQRDVTALSGYAMEDAIAAMTPAQRERWLRS